MTNNPTDFEDAYKCSQEDFKALEGKKGFELYQTYRDILLSAFSTHEGAERYSRPIFEESEIIKLKLIDQKYIDNFLLCVSLRLNAPEEYEELKQIIDRNIKPSKPSQGWAHVYKEMSGTLVLFLDAYENVAIRQADVVSSHLFDVAENFSKARYLKQKKNYKLSDDKLPDIYALALLFFCLQKKDKSVDTIKAIVPGNKRSENELKKAIQGYVCFKKEVFDNYIGVAEKLLASEEKTILHNLDEEVGLNFILDKNYPDIPSEYEIFAVICIALGMELMPNFMHEPEKFLNFLVK